MLDQTGDHISKTTMPLRQGAQATRMTSPRKTINVSMEEDNEEPAASRPQQTAVRAAQPDKVETLRTTMTAEKNPTFTSVDLPSRFHFYGGMKSLSVGTVYGAHQAKFARASKLESTKLTVETVTSLLGDNVDAKWLTIPDFFWLMYFMRINFYPEGSHTYKAVCMSPGHLSAVNQGTKTQESLVTVSIVKKTDVKETILSDEDIAKLEDIDQTPFLELGYKLTAPRMVDSIDLEQNYSEKEDFDEISYLADYAACLARVDGSWDDLSERIKAVAEMPVSMTRILDQYMSLAQNYGVEEIITTKCKDCGADVETEVSVSAHDFL